MPTISESRPQVSSETSICHGPGLKSLREYYVSHFPSVNHLGINKELLHYERSSRRTGCQACQGSGCVKNDHWARLDPICSSSHSRSIMLSSILKKYASGGWLAGWLGKSASSSSSHVHVWNFRPSLSGCQVTLTRGHTYLPMTSTVAPSLQVYQCGLAH